VFVVIVVVVAMIVVVVVVISVVVVAVVIVVADASVVLYHPLLCFFLNFVRVPVRLVTVQQDRGQYILHFL